MIAEIQYQGYTTQPSDYNNQDGDLACAMNIVPEKGGLAPILPPRIVAQFPNHTILAMHKTPSVDNYILCSRQEQLSWVPVSATQGDVNVLKDFSNENGVKSVTPIGNTFIALDGQGNRHYFLWSEDRYKYLGNDIPDLDMSARLNTTCIDVTEFLKLYGLDSGEFNTIITGVNSDLLTALQAGITTRISLYGDARTWVYNQVFSIVNRMQKRLRKDNYFLYPFYVRFAYRLYDGTHTKHTPPILLAPSTWGKPFTSVIFLDNIGFYDIYFYASKLTASIISSRASLPDWKDIITGIDVFVTPPIINYTDNIEAVKSISVYPFRKVENNSWVITDDAPKIMQRERFYRCDKYFTEGENNYSITSIHTYKQGKILFSFKETKSFTNVFLAIDLSVGNPVITPIDGTPSIRPIADFFTNDEYKDARAVLPKEGVYAVYDVVNDLETAGVCLFSEKAMGITIAGPVTSNKTNPLHQVELERIDTASYEKELQEYNTFYKVAEIPFSEVMDWKSYLSVPLKENVLTYLETQPTLSDMGQGRVSYKSSLLQSYNNRLNIIVDKERYMPVNIGSQNSCIEIDNTKNIHSAFVELSLNAQSVYVELTLGTSLRNEYRIPYTFSYPNASARRLILFIYGSEDTGDMIYSKYEIELASHPFLNLASAFNNFDALSFDVTSFDDKDTFDAEIASMREKNEVLFGNKVAVSQASNPFVFPEGNMIDLSQVSRVYTLASAAQPLSEGQFGQYPLYAFTDEGIWSIEVTSQGTYSAKQPITRDICTRPQSITSLDSSILFATDKGIMELAGRNTLCISDILDGEGFDLSHLDYARKAILGQGFDNFDIAPWKLFLQRVQMIYDYINQRIIVFNTLYKYAYVYSLQSKQWGIMQCDIASTFNSYPEACAMTHDGLLLNYSFPNARKAKGYFVTRPIKITSPNRYKTIISLIQRGNFKKGALTTMLYGSRDLQTWYPVYASADHYLRGMRGTPYKYFRVAATFNLKEHEIINGCSVQFEERLNNKLR